MKKYIIPAIIFFFILFSFWPTIYEWNSQGRIKPIRFFELVHNFPTDYNFYLSRIRQGKEGSILANEKYTSEVHDPSLVQVLYVFIGRVSDWVHVQTPYVWFSYHVMRGFFGVLLLLVTWKLVEWFFDQAQPLGLSLVWKIVTFLLAVTASTWPKFESVDGWPRFGGYMPWYSVIDSLQRITFLPHVLFGQALLVFILWVFGGGFIKTGREEDGKKGRIHPGNWVFLGVVGIVEGIVFPPGLLFIYVVLAVQSILSWSRRNLYPTFIFFVLSAPSMIYYQLLLGQYPWKRLVEFDVLHPTQFSYIEYFLAVGPVLPLGLLGTISVLFLSYKQGNNAIMKPLRMLVSWVISWLGLILLFHFIPEQSPTRFTQMFPHVPLAILGCYFFFSLGRTLSKPLVRNPFTFYLLPFSFFIPILIVLFALGSMFSSWLWQKDFIDHKLRADYPAVPHGAEVMYPLKSIIAGLDWLQVYTPRSAVVLSGVTTGNYIPVYAGNTTFIGHANTVNSETKEAAVANFYRNRLSEKEEMAWVTSQGIDYIFYGPEERDIAGGLSDLRSHYPQLKAIYDADSVTIYQVP